MPDKIDPVVLLKEKALICPFCKEKHAYYNEGGSYNRYHRDADKKGVTHKVFRFLNKYYWEKTKCVCGKCKCSWESEWYPSDHDFFKIEVGDNENIELYLDNKKVGDDDE